MADNRTRQLLPASFKGVTFSVFSESAPENGRKLVIHEYVNSDERFVEDQGQIPPKFEIRAFVHGVDFIARAARLEQALNEVGPGQLSMPVFGVVEAHAGAYSKDASQQSVGEISYTIPFFTGRPAPGPSAARVGIEDVYQTGDEARSAIEEIFDTILPIMETADNALAAVGDLNNIVATVQEAVATILPVEDLEKVFRLGSNIQLNSAKLVRNATALGSLSFSGSTSIPGLWQQISLGLSRTGSLDRGIAELIFLTNLGGGLSLSINDVNRAATQPQTSTVPLWPATTRQRIDRNNARQALVQSNRLSSLVGLYEVAAGKEYATDDEVSETRTAIEDIHERIMRDETADNSLIQSNPTVRAAVETMRLNALAVIGQKEQSAFRITDDRVNAPTSALVRAYLLYAESFTNSVELTDRTSELANLNTSLPSAELVDEFKIFEV